MATYSPSMKTMYGTIEAVLRANLLNAPVEVPLGRNFETTFLGFLEAADQMANNPTPPSPTGKWLYYTLRALGQGRR